jgi:adenine-specific DNA-methyltransferase
MKQLELFDTSDSYDRLDISNRKYLGSKQKLLSFIERSVLDRVPEIGTFCDGFSGTGVVAYHFRKYADRIVANDILYSNYIVNQTFLNSSQESVSLDKVTKLLRELNNSKPVEGYVFRSYGGTYFTYDNAGFIDAVREKIEYYYHDGACSEQEKYVLLTSLLFAVDKAANTVGQYDAFLKHIGKESYDRVGRHLIDSNVYKRIRLRLPNIEFDGRNEVYNEDINELISRISGDVLYLDPPYNSRQYIDCYHVLENILRWDKPQLYGKTKKFNRGHLKSLFSKKSEASGALSELIAKADFRHIFISYNNEGIIPDGSINTSLQKRGKVEVLEEDYVIFGSGAGRSVRRPITERLFCCEVTSPPRY